MKFSTKIFLVYMAIYIVVMTVIGVTVTENSYENLKQQEIQRSLDEEENVYSNIGLYLMNSMMMNKEQAELVDYGVSIVDLFSSNSSYLEVFDENLQLLATNSPVIWNQPREELTVASEGKLNIMLRYDEVGRYYLFISNYLELDNQSIVLSMVKDISYIEQQKMSQYIFFLKVGCMGLVIVALLVGAFSKFLVEPIKKLDSAAQKIAAGNFKERVKITSNDEVGSLAIRFNMMADEIEKKIHELELESYRQQRFIDNLNHESRTPLTSIIGYAELLQKVEYDPELFQRGLAYIHTEGKRILNLNKMLMDLTFYREGEFELETQWVSPICHNVKELMMVKAKEKNISIQVVGEDIKIPLERDLLKGILINLIDNAIKASEDNTDIIIGIETCGRGSCVYVKDFGKGMEHKELDRIKEPFYRVDKARSRQDGGVGLGVAICNQIAQTLDAKLEYESEKGKGTTAKIIFVTKTN